jgi:hypothetical protein
MTITSRILKRLLKRLTISRHKVNIELHRSLSSLVISKRSSIEKILNIILLRQKKTLRREGDLNPKKVAQRTKIRYKKLITKTSLNKGNVLRVSGRDKRAGPAHGRDPTADPGGVPSEQDVDECWATKMVIGENSDNFIQFREGGWRCNQRRWRRD